MFACVDSRVCSCCPLFLLHSHLIIPDIGRLTEYLVVHATVTNATLLQRKLVFAVFVLSGFVLLFRVSSLLYHNLIDDMRMKWQQFGCQRSCREHSLILCCLAMYWSHVSVHCAYHQIKVTRHRLSRDTVDRIDEKRMKISKSPKRRK